MVEINKINKKDTGSVLNILWGFFRAKTSDLHFSILDLHTCKVSIEKYNVFIQKGLNGLQCSVPPGHCIHCSCTVVMLTPLLNILLNMYSTDYIPTLFRIIRTVDRED